MPGVSLLSSPLYPELTVTMALIPGFVFLFVAVVMCFR